MRLASDGPDVHRYVSDGGSPTMLSCGSCHTLSSRLCCGTVLTALYQLATSVPLVMSCLVSPDRRTRHRQLRMT